MAQVTLREYLQEIEDTLSAGHVDDAGSKCQHVLARFPEALEVQRLLGEVHLAKGQMEDAQQALDWILTNDPENVIAYCDRALISEHLSDIDTALDCYQQAYELSRGNRDIRQQFNVLSAKAGQQGFMFSRAGLARLYIRGGLLPQAIQEWDAVLAVSPDRLDARTGLLEAYWREGLYDEAEQLALQTLQDVPGCVKALLILAHITSPKNMQQAREYVQRAELLDPDLLMAQELFEDMVMSQAGHPFLKLLKKSPTMIDTERTPTALSHQASAEPVFAHVSASQEASTVSKPPAYESSASATLFDWNNSDAWRSALETPATSDAQSSADTLPTWSHDTFSDAWTLPAQPQESQELHKQESVPPSEQSLNSLVTAPGQQEQPVEQGLHGLSHLAELTIDEPEKNGHEVQQTHEPLWMSGIQDNTVSTPPAWLSMLTQDETRGQRQAEEVPPVIEEREQPPIETPILSQPHLDTTSANEVNEDDSWRSALQASLNATTDVETFSFGPEWLKSLGATELEPKEQEQAASLPLLNTQSEPIPQSAELKQPLSTEQEPRNEMEEMAEPEVSSLQASSSSTHTWLDALSAEPEYTQHPEQSIVNTLEDLENSLLSEGFVPLEPNSLATIAQSQPAPLDTSSESSNTSQETHEEKPYATPMLSSALEQLGNLAAPHAAYQTPDVLTPETQAVTTSSSEELLWIDSYRSVPAPLQKETQAAYEPAPLAGFSEPIYPSSIEPNGVFQEQQVPPAVFVEDFAKPVQEPEQANVHNIPAAPVGNADAFFESELETTMKRPAIRLQAMKQSIPATPYSSVNREFSNGSKSVNGSGRESAHRLQERLIQGYQHQLFGDYDEAMHEYRIIIKNAPELLEEVVSNVRALLKLAPQYSPGYRVLGDAYMRLGEYLQAMEAYNKALTMAKKARV